jgi:hypothetical protein
LVSVSLIIQLQSALFFNAYASVANYFSFFLSHFIFLVTLTTPVSPLVILAAFNPRGSEIGSICLCLENLQLLS